MPTIGDLHTFAGTEDKPEEGYRSRYDKSTEKASAGYYSVFLSDYKIQAEATALPHSGMLRFTFPESKEARIQVDLARRVGGTSTLQSVEVVDDHTIKGWMQCTPDGGGWGNGDGKADYTVYFYAQFSKPFPDMAFGLPIFRTIGDVNVKMFVASAIAKQSAKQPSILPFRHLKAST